MKYFSLPADFKNETIDKFAALNQAYDDCKVMETYGNITIGNKFGSGRTLNLLPDIDLEKLSRFVNYSREKGIGFNYTFNASFMGNQQFHTKGIAEMKTFLGDLHHAGVRSLTIAMPSIIELVQSMPYDFDIKASAICQITNPDKALAYKRMGIQRIVVDESINRDFQTLKRIRDCFGEAIDVIANNICYKNCIYRMFHYNQISGDSVENANKTGCDYFVNRCVLQRYENISNLLKINWIRPEDLHYYTGIGIENFKLQGRQSVIEGDPIRTLEHYFKEDYDGDLMQLLDMFNPMTKFRLHIDNKKLDGFLKKFHQDETFCKNDCTGCNYCEVFATRSIDYGQAKKTADMAREFYTDYDDYNHMLKDKTANTTAKKLFDEGAVDVDFDF